jgi:hypothetical protein
MFACSSFLFHPIIIAAPTPAPIHMAVEEVRLMLRDDREWNHVLWWLNYHSGVRPPDGYKTWNRTNVKRLLLDARLRRHTPVQTQRAEQ